MRCITDIIEHHLKKILNESPTGMIEIKRSELAHLFQCVPSQINYVISTRFTLEKGYVVESKRGGGGFIRIRKVKHASKRTYFDVLLKQIGQSIHQAAAEDVIDRLRDDGIITEREAKLMRKSVSREVLTLPVNVRDQVRAGLMRAWVAILLADKGE
ncbi:transcriptional regulator [Polycladomyces abyssicola]|jgi:transcriptional regulator of stress and heat shock response|uniref:Transcriptional regulator CtsR n=1 Tax=Polycladomyces abyssicola TaxID=1125966 RepID=A0A8D5ZL76_9BACL|nr:CtsR family transcriptional regulator [Polycladomyces abyssicola]BCU80355.1 transcriptional regulator [Polycladomyces abyssicola]